MGIPSVGGARRSSPFVVDGMDANYHRSQRETARATAEFVNRRVAPLPGSTSRMAVQVFDAGNIPNVPGVVYMTYPVQIDADDTEGVTPSFSTDTGSPVPVIVLNNSAVAGDNLIAHAVGGRWFAEKTGSNQPKCFTKVCVCQTSCAGTVCLPGVSILIEGGGGCVTDSTGCCTLEGRGTITIEHVGCNPFQANCSSGGCLIEIPNPPGYVCCNGCLIPTTLSVSDANGTWTATSMNGGWGVSYLTTKPTYVNNQEECILGTGGNPCANINQSGTIQVGYFIQCVLIQPGDVLGLQVTQFTPLATFSNDVFGCSGGIGCLCNQHGTTPDCHYMCNFGDCTSECAIGDGAVCVYSDALNASLPGATAGQGPVSCSGGKFSSCSVTLGNAFCPTCPNPAGLNISISA